MDVRNGNLYRPDDDVPDDAVLLELERAEYEALIKMRQEDVEGALKREHAKAFTRANTRLDTV